MPTEISPHTFAIFVFYVAVAAAVWTLITKAVSHAVA